MLSPRPAGNGVGRLGGTFAALFGQSMPFCRNPCKNGEAMSRHVLVIEDDDVTQLVKLNLTGLSCDVTALDDARTGLAPALSRIPQWRSWRPPFPARPKAGRHFTALIHS